MSETGHTLVTGSEPEIDGGALTDYSYQMNDSQKFLSTIETEFAEDRLTWQKSVATFHPESAEEAARLFAFANSQKAPLYISGYGNNITPVGLEYEKMVTVSTDRLNQIGEVANEDFFVQVGSGFPLRELNRHLSQSDLFFPLGNLPYVGSVGGAIACSLSATLNGHLLPIKKYLLKATVVTPTGEIITPGSVCFKSVSGYDIVKIFSPSWGLLGLLTSVTLRVLPSTADSEYEGMRQNEIDRNHFLSGLTQDSDDPDVLYSLKIKNKFDPNSILPVV